MKLKSIFLHMSLIVSLLYADDENLTTIEKKAKDNRSLEIEKGLTTVKKTYKEATNDEDSTKWNSKDWEKYLNEKGTNQDIIGNSQMNLHNFSGTDEAFSGNPNSMRTEDIRKEKKYQDVKSLHSFSDDLLNNIVSSTVSHNSKNLISDSTTKCYITRDIPLRYKCSFNGLMYGGSMDSDGSMAKNQCEDECYEQYESVEIVKEGSINSISINNIEIKTSEEKDLSTYKVSKNQKEMIKNENVINNITFDYEVNENKKIYLTIKHLDHNNVYSNLITNLPLQNSGSKSLTINALTKEIIYEVSADEMTTVGIIKNIKLNINGGKFICPLHQDISKKNAGNFAYLCPSGKIKTFPKGHKSYTICEDYGIVGDNLDGTFSTLESANAICKKNYECSLDITTMNTAILQTFREGCIEGQNNCKQNTCKELRVNGATIINENVFDGGLYPKQSIINKTQIQGVNRPRILLREDLDFQTRTAEELKDEAYQNMILNNKYVISNVKLNENTVQSSAYNIGMGGNSNTYLSNINRSLFWVLKPDSFSVGTNIKMYAIYDVMVNRKIINEKGKGELIKDRIFYIQIDNNDNLKPFARIYNFATNVMENNSLVHSNIETSSLEYKSFNKSTKKWYSHSSNLIAEYFNSEVLVLENSPFKRIKLISELNNLVYTFPGIKSKEIKTGPVVTPVYEGDYDGSGETIAKVTVYTHYSNKNLTYKEIIDKINNKEIEPIYDTLSFDKYSKEVSNDGSSKDYQLYLYGQSNNKTGYVRLFPKTEDVGKNGFIFIFAVED